MGDFAVRTALIITKFYGRQALSIELRQQEKIMLDLLMFETSRMSTIDSWKFKKITE